MADYGHDLLFGVQLEAVASRIHDVVALAELSENAGLDLISLPDHPYWPQWLDTPTVLATIAARTSKVRMFANVANLPLRPPATLARTAVALDLLSGGRFELGIGAGAAELWNSIVGEGGPRRSAGESIEALEEAIRVVRALWRPGAPVDFDGKHYQLRGAVPGPAPAHPIQIWLGAYQPRALRVVGTLADGWVASSPFLTPDGLGAAAARIDRAATEAGRSPSEIRRIYDIEGEFGRGSGLLHGPAELWAEQLTEISLTHGVSAYMICGADASGILRFAEEVAPAVRAAVARERSAA
jgi:alkanesulfonate monooxygenase SsuD/methylene tetrahydromethanopterin reductase-like flavin-dependent oxidoreductase (luciferase family)